MKRVIIPEGYKSSYNGIRTDRYWDHDGVIEVYSSIHITKGYLVIIERELSDG